MLCGISFLEDLKTLVENKPEDMTLDEEAKSTVGMNYRVRLDKQVVLEPISDDKNA